MACRMSSTPPTLGIATGVGGIVMTLTANGSWRMQILKHSKCTPGNNWHNSRPDETSRREAHSVTAAEILTP